MRASVIVWLVAVFCLPAGAVWAAEPTTTTTAAAAPVIHAATLDGDMINPATADYILKGLADAEDAGAAAFLLRMDTPGGMLQSTRQIIKALLGARIPVITYVQPGGAQAGSAGMFITIAGHVAAMAPGTNIGAAHPVGGQGEDIEKAGGKDLAEKVENDARAFAEAIAAERGRNAEWAAAAVTSSVSITAEQALREKVIDLVSPSDRDLLEAIDGREVKIGQESRPLRTKGARIVEIEMSVKQQFVNWLADPNVAYLLMTIGFLGIYFELSNPGLIFPGVIGGLSLVLAFVALQVIPFNAAGLALIGLALLLFVLEAFVTSFGLLTIGGVIAMGLGGLLLFDTPETTMQISLRVLIPVTLFFGVVAAILSLAVARAMRRKVVTGQEGMIGMVGRATQPLAPAGTVFVNGELWSAIAESPVDKDASVVVTGVDGLILKVRKEDGHA